MLVEHRIVIKLGISWCLGYNEAHVLTANVEFLEQLVHNQTLSA